MLTILAVHMMDADAIVANRNLCQQYLGKDVVPLVLERTLIMRNHPVPRDNDARDKAILLFFPQRAIETRRNVLIRFGERILASRGNFVPQSRQCRRKRKRRTSC
jgi:hypothetical protein